MLGDWLGVMLRGGSELATLLLSPWEEGGAGRGGVVGGGGACREGAEVIGDARRGGVTSEVVRLCPPFSVTDLVSCGL